MSAGDHINWKRFLLPVAFLGVGTLVAILWLAGGPLRFLHWIEGGSIGGVLAYAFVYVLATLLLLPPGVLNMAAGVMFGPVIGAVLALAANVLSAMITFVVSRSFARDWVAGRIARRRGLLAVDRALEKGGLKVVLLLRMSPVSPFSVLNYALGISRVRPRDYVVGSVLGTVPGTVLYVYIGSLLTDLAQIFTTRAGASARTLFLSVGLMATIAGFSIVTRLARQELRRLAAE
jgi:uncharacterized membrane protein YdjX (TVP38/TMEM64 family)